MSKLIFSENVIKEITDISSSIVGHEIVVYKNIGGKLKLYEHLSENQRFEEERKGFLQGLLNRGSETYVGYAVDLNKYLKSEHSEPYIHSDNKVFDLTYSIEYRVINVSRLVAKVIEANEDALENLRVIVDREIKQKLLDDLNVLDLSDLSEFRRYARTIAETGAMNDIPANDAFAQKTANTYSAINRQLAEDGLYVSQIYISRALSQEELDEIKERDRLAKLRAAEDAKRARDEEIKRAALKNQMETADAQAKHDLEAEDRRRKQEIIEAQHQKEKERVQLLAEIRNIPDYKELDQYEKSKRGSKIQMDALEEAIKRVAGTVNTAFDFREAMDEVMKAFLSASNMNGASSFDSGGQGQIFTPNAKLLTARLDNKPLAELVSTATQFIELLNNPHIPGDKVLSTMSEVLHLLGELILGGNAAADKLEEQHQRVNTEFGSIRQYLKLRHPGDLGELINLEALKNRFSVT